MAVRTPVSGAILCGGGGRRMGGADKGSLLVGGQTILDRLLDALRPLTPHLMIIDRDATHTTAADVRVVPDLVPDCGAVGGIYTALESSATDRVMIVACDMPFLTTAFLSFLVDLDDTADVVIPRDAQGRRPLCGVFHRRIAPALKARLETRTLRVDAALAGLDVRDVTEGSLAHFNADGRLMMNVNTPEDYRSAADGHHYP